MIAVANIVIPFIFAGLTMIKPAKKASLILLFLAAASNLIISLMASNLSNLELSLVFKNYLVFDTTNSLFLILISIIFFGVSLHVIGRCMASPIAAQNIHKYVALSLIFLGFLSGSILSNHLILTWALIEASALSITPLIYYQRRISAFRAAWRYLLFSSVSLSLVFFGFAFISRGISFRLGHGEVTFMADQLLALTKNSTSTFERLGFGLILFGYCSKLGLAPLYSWLPETYDEAPPAVTSLLAAVQFNAVVLAVFKIVQIFRPTNGGVVFWELTTMGILSMLIATVNIATTRNYKRLVAYTAINHIGVVSIGLGIGGSAIYGTIVYVFSNALVKAMVFLTAGNIKAKYRTKDSNALHGLIQEMPYSGFFLMVGIWALLGFAPFGSFLGEVVIMNGLIQGGSYFIFATFCILLIITFVAMGRTTFPMIWGETGQPLRVTGESLYVIIPNVFFLLLLLSLGIYLPKPINDSLRAMASTLGG